jgi:type I restriction enzyme S subunit
MKWEKVEIGQIGTVITGNTPPRKNPELYGDYIPFIKPTDIETERRFTPNPEECYSELGYEKYKNSLIPKGSTCVVTIGSIGKKMTQAYCDCFINQAVNAILPNDNFDKDYVFYLLKNNLDKVKGLDSGTSSGRENVSKSAFSSIEVRVIKNLSTQRRIASILSAYDDLIENNLKRIKLLEEKARLHYLEMISFSAKWDKVRLEEFVSVVKGRKPANVLEQPEDDSQLYLLLDTVERTKTLYTSDLTLPVSKETDVLMCMDGARSGLSFRGMIGAISSTMAIWRSNSNKISGEFLFQFLKQNESAITQGNTGAAIPHANRKFILDMKISMPHEKEAQEFEVQTNPMIKLINIMHNQNTLLRQARDILLPRLMSGEIEIV